MPLSYPLLGSEPPFLIVVLGILASLIISIHIILALLIGPVLYYRVTIFNSNALYEEYAARGIRLQGRVVWRQKTQIGVVYGVGDDQFAKELDVPLQLYSQTTLELIRLPEYPRSAILYTKVEDADPDFPPSNLLFLIFALFWIMWWNIIPIISVLLSIESCTYCTLLIVPVFFLAIVLEFTVGYGVAKRKRDGELRWALYGAKLVGGESGTNTTPTSTPPSRISYSEFFHEEPHSCLFVIRSIMHDVLLVIAFIVSFFYFVCFAGGFLLMYYLVVARWKRLLLERYDTEGTSVVGSVMTRQGDNQVIVQYYDSAADTHYKKRLEIPYHRSGFSIEYKKIPDNPELMYLTNRPASAQLKLRIDNRHEETKYFWTGILARLFFLTIQVSFAAWTINDYPEDLEDFVLVAIICLVCLLGAWIHYRFVFQRKQLYGAKRVYPRCTQHKMELVDEEQGQDLAEGMNNNDMDAMQATASTTNENANAFVDNFMSDKFPLFDKVASATTTNEGANGFVDNFMNGKFPRLDRAIV